MSIAGWLRSRTKSVGWGRDCPSFNSVDLDLRFQALFREPKSLQTFSLFIEAAQSTGLIPRQDWLASLRKGKEAKDMQAQERFAAHLALGFKDAQIMLLFAMLPNIQTLSIGTPPHFSSLDLEACLRLCPTALRRVRHLHVPGTQVWLDFLSYTPKLRTINIAQSSLYPTRQDIKSPVPRFDGNSVTKVVIHGSFDHMYDDLTSQLVVGQSLSHFSYTNDLTMNSGYAMGRTIYQKIRNQLINDLSSSHQTLKSLSIFCLRKMTDSSQPPATAPTVLPSLQNFSRLEYLEILQEDLLLTGIHSFANLPPSLKTLSIRAADENILPFLHIIPDLKFAISESLNLIPHPATINVALRRGRKKPAPPDWLDWKNMEDVVEYCDRPWLEDFGFETQESIIRDLAGCGVALTVRQSYKEGWLVWDEVPPYNNWHP